MFEEVQCPTPAFKRIIDSGIDKRILEKKRKIESILIYGKPFVEPETEEIFESAKKYIFEAQGKISQKTAVYQDVLDLDLDLNEASFITSSEIGKYLINHPSLLGFFVLGEELFDFKKFGFPSRRSLEESITSFCMGERHLFDLCSDSDYWRNGDYKNGASQSVHGDMFISQTELSGREWKESTFFGEETHFDTFKKNPQGSGIAAYQDWSFFLISLLKYAEHSDMKNIPEIANWKEVLKEGGEVNCASTEGMFGSGELEYRMMRNEVKESVLLTDKLDKLERFPIMIPYGENAYIPIVMDKKLIYLVENKNGDIEIQILKGFFEGKKFSKQMIYDSKDLQPALRATYRLFSRDRRMIPVIMNAFLNKEESRSV